MGSSGTRQRSRSPTTPRGAPIPSVRAASARRSIERGPANARFRSSTRTSSQTIRTPPVRQRGEHRALARSFVAQHAPDTRAGHERASVKGLMAEPMRPHGTHRRQVRMDQRRSTRRRRQRERGARRQAVRRDAPAANVQARHPLGDILSGRRWRRSRPQTHFDRGPVRGCVHELTRGYLDPDHTDAVCAPVRTRRRGRGFRPHRRAAALGQHQRPGQNHRGAALVSVGKQPAAQAEQLLMGTPTMPGKRIVPTPLLAEDAEVPRFFVEEPQSLNAWRLVGHLALGFDATAVHVVPLPVVAPHVSGRKITVHSSEKKSP